MANWNPKTKAGHYVKNILVATDQLLGTFAGYSPDETISSKIGKLHEQPGGIPKNRPVARLLYKVLNAIQKKHCENAIEYNEGFDDIRDPELQKKYGGRKCPRCNQIIEECVCGKEI